MPDPRDINPEEFDTELPAGGQEQARGRDERDWSRDERNRDEPFDPSSTGDEHGEVM